VADLRSELAAALAGRYTIERELGRGGMATVFLARDLKHDRPVALKVLHGELAATLGPERFEREIKLAARLQHPHILTMLDSGEAGGQLWFTMPFVEGSSLRDRLRKERQLPVDEAVRMTREAAQALEYAHQHGVIHRDIKPENLLLTSDGNTLVADFGIARAIGGGEEQLTQTGTSIGTPAYMSPEQAAGDRHLDARTDIYSLACVLYEMLAGEPPYTGPTMQALVAKRLTGEVPRVRQVRPAVPENVEQAIVRALAPVPADRFPSAAEFARALAPASAAVATAGTAIPTAPVPKVQATAVRTPRPGRRLPFALVTMVLGFTVGLGILFAWRRSHPESSSGSAGARRLAVLPFENLGDSSDEYFADGVTDEVRGKLAKLPGLQVIASGSTGQYKHSTKAPQQIAQELGVQYLLTGKIRWEKGDSGRSRVRVSPELVQVDGGGAPTTKWQEPFDASLTDVFQVQADIAGRVAKALDVALGSNEREKLAARPTQNLVAYDAYLKGEEVSASIGTGDPATLRQAVAYYERAVALDSGFVQAWAQLARARSRIYSNSAPLPAQGEAARVAAERAMALAPNRPEGRLALGTYYSEVKNDNIKALEQFELGQRVDPRNADLLAGIAVAEQSLGRWAQVVQHLTEAQTVDPRSLQAARRLARAQLWLRRYPTALAAADRGLRLAPTNIDILEVKAMVYLGQGDLAGARAVVQQAPAEMDPTTLVAGFAGFWDLFWVLDREQQQLLFRLTPGAFDDNRSTWALALAATYALRGETAKAHAYADSSRISLESQMAANAEDSQLHVLYGVALAYLGRKEEAVRAGRRSVAMAPISQDAFTGSYNQHQLARIYCILGQQEKALEQLEPLLKIPYFLSPGWLKIDPTFDPLRKNPRFQKLLEGTS
jgi:serine/threonine protein kinase/tetratricopeptide (TPR) repeat protein